MVKGLSHLASRFPVVLHSDEKQMKKFSSMQPHPKTLQEYKENK